jgi:hypothetical protein
MRVSPTSARASTTWRGTQRSSQGRHEAHSHRSDGAALDGSGQAPALADADFIREWNGQPLSDLFERIHTTMPGDAPGTLKQADVADVLAFLLQKGGHPAGQSELPGDPAPLKSITFKSPR